MKSKYYKSTIIAWKCGQGYGFVANPAGKEDLFLHINDIQGKHIPSPGDVVRFQLKQGPNGKPAVYNACLTKYAAIAAANWSLVGVITIIPFVLSILTFSNGALPLALYSFMSVLCFLMVRSDKHRAEARRWRISDSSMHLTQLLWGWPGSLVAQKIYFHKARKKSFQGTLNFIIFMHLLFWIDAMMLDHLILNFIIHVLEYFK